MAKFRKKPIVIEAEQWFPGKEIEGVMHPVPDTEFLVPFAQVHGADVAVIDTLEGRMFVSPGDWIITGVKGERYPCRPDIFEATYEAVDDKKELLNALARAGI